MRVPPQPPPVDRSAFRADVVRECEELHDRIGGMRNYVGSERFQSFDQIAQDLILTQYGLMMALHRAICNRLARFESEVPDCVP